MPITGIYFIPSHPNSTTSLPIITERLRSAFPSEDLVPIGRWALEHKLMRDTPGLLPPSANASQRTKPRYMQFLSLSHYPTHGFIYTSEPTEKPFHPPNAASPTPATSPGGGGSTNVSPPASTPSQSGSTGTGTTSTAATDISPMVMTTIPPSSYGTLFHHFTYACQPFWCHRLTLAVPNGVVYDVGDFRVRMGDVRQTYPAARVRGTAIEIEWRGPSVVDSITTSPQGGSTSTFLPGGVGQDADSGIDVSLSAIEEADVEAEYVATASLIREFWGRLGVEGGREAILVPGVGREVREKLGSWRGGRPPGIGSESLRDEVGLAGGVNGLMSEEDPDPSAGVDVARQYMEVLRFNR